jgi:hypothetical protein
MWFSSKLSICYFLDAKTTKQKSANGPVNIAKSHHPNPLLFFA